MTKNFSTSSQESKKLVEETKAHLLTHRLILIVLMLIVILMGVLFVSMAKNNDKLIERKAELEMQLHDLQQTNEKLIEEVSVIEKAMEEQKVAENVKISTTEPVISEVIENKCREAGLSDWEIEKFKSIAICESELKPTAQNKYSTAAGLFQIVKSTYLENSPYSWEDRYEIEPNIETAIAVYKRYGFKAWQCS